MKKVLIIAPNFPPESVGGASRIFEMAKKIQSDYDVSVICPPPTYPFTKYNKSNQIFKKKVNEIKWSFNKPIKDKWFENKMKYFSEKPGKGD